MIWRVIILDARPVGHYFACSFINRKFRFKHKEWWYDSKTLTLVTRENKIWLWRMGVGGLFELTMCVVTSRNGILWLGWKKILRESRSLIEANCKIEQLESNCKGDVCWALWILRQRSEVRLTLKLVLNVWECLHQNQNRPSIFTMLLLAFWILL